MKHCSESRILLTSYFYEFDFGGAEMVAQTLAGTLRDHGAQVDILCLAGGNSAINGAKRIHVIHQRLWRWPHLVKRGLIFLNNRCLDRWIYQKALSLQLPWREYHLIHCQDLNALQVSYLLAKRFNKRLILTLHDHPVRTFPRLNYLLSRRAEGLMEAFLYCDPVICVSDYIARELNSFCLFANIQVIYNTVCGAFAPRPSHRGQRVLFAGRLSTEKGLDLAVEAFRWLPNTATMTIAGLGGPLEPWCHTLAYTDPQITFLGKVPHNQIPNLMAEHDVVCCPSMKPEPFGLVALEARMMQKSVVATNLGATPEVLNNYSRAILIDPAEFTWHQLVGEINSALYRAIETLEPLDVEAEHRHISSFSPKTFTDSHFQAYGITG